MPSRMKFITHPWSALQHMMKRLSIILLSLILFSLGLNSGHHSIFQNIALHKPSIQSGITAGGVASRATDGNRNSIWEGASCTATSNHSGSWWSADLEGTFPIADVVIVNRNILGNRLHDFYVGLLSNPPSSPLEIPADLVCFSYVGPATNGEVLDLACDQVSATAYCQMYMSR